MFFIALVKAEGRSVLIEVREAMDLKDHRMKLNDGHFIPILGFGTAAPEEVPKSKAEEYVRLAIDAGFYHIDSAYVYGSEEEVGRAIRSKFADGTVNRSDIFYTSKLWSTFLRPELVRPALERSLKKLQMDYVDLYIIHFPFAMKTGEELFPVDEDGKYILDTVDLCAIWEALEKCKDAGLTKSIGVSNFNHKQLEKILKKPGLKYKPVCNQIGSRTCGDGAPGGSAFPPVPRPKTSPASQENTVCLPKSICKGVLSQQSLTSQPSIREFLSTAKPLVKGKKKNKNPGHRGSGASGAPATAAPPTQGGNFPRPAGTSVYIL
ncbi:dihydrodiol dehydrogenase 3-like isoform X2 [Dasypus novemcinctus]|uniref:dihydrodiol dehydrogenase 3-like isoform X2 n=1 Tax=Dasypus novemcinctus TaxID=9361 RepID=UPI00265F9B5E|nr:dihydrodiol dehydrogenase 3-like isoform X2 [Dasypus novemcinctus]